MCIAPVDKLGKSRGAIMQMKVYKRNGDFIRIICHKKERLFLHLFLLHYVYLFFKKKICKIIKIFIYKIIFSNVK